MDVFEIDGRVYDVIVEEVEENFNVLYSENTGRTMSTAARMVLDPLGTFFGHKITVKRKPGKEREFDDLYDYISTPWRNGITVKLLHNQTTIEYDAYVSNGKRSVVRVSNSDAVHWDELQLNIVPMEAQVRPK